MKKILKECRKKNIARRVINIVLVIALLLGVLPIELIVPKLSELITMTVHAEPANSRKADVVINDLNALVAYSIEYQNNDERYSEDTITLTLNSGELHTLSESFKSLGTQQWPFNGKIFITATYGEGWYFNTDKPLFAYVTDSVTINYAITEHNTDPVPIEIRRKFVDSTSSVALSPLFASHVTHNEYNASGTTATWKIKAAPYVDSQENVNTYNFSGLIGSMEKDAQVSVSFANDSYYAAQSIYSNIQGPGDIGLICGTMEQSSRIDLTLSGTNTFCNIESSTSGNAGGLVGTMNAGSVLNIQSISYVPNNNRSVKAVSGYAGGLVGYSAGGSVVTSASTSIRGTVEGTTGAGGLYGYYSNPATVSGETQTPQDVTFDLANFDVDCTVKANAAGGLFGMLSSTANVTVEGNAAGANEITVTGNSVTSFGGIAGSYQASNLANSFRVDTVTANTSASLTGTSYYGGVCGQIAGENQPAYIQVSSLTHKSSAGYDGATAFGGVVGNAGTAGSMLDVGSVTIETGVTAEATSGAPFVGGGVVGVLDAGVLRLSGTTDLSKAPSMAVDEKYNCGQLVGVRKDALVYAVGTGSDSGWTFTRSNADVYADDIGTWGCVLRPDATNLPLANLEASNGSGVLKFDTARHEVTVAAPVTSITNAVDYTKTALNMQLNSGDKGALLFDDDTNTKAVLLGINLTVSGTINLAGTGNIGLTRDDYKDDVNEIGEYTGAISGGTVNLAIGERYAYSGGSPLGRGAIIAHRYNGLIARTGSKNGTSASFGNMTVGGSITVNSKVTLANNDNKATMFIGGAAAQVDDGITLTNVTSSETINYTGSRDFNPLIGGLVGNVKNGSAKPITVSGVTAGATINLSGSLGTDAGHSAGGVIGRISATAAHNINISATTVSTTITTPSVTDVSAAGLIADIVDSSHTRTVNLTGVTVNGTSITNNATSHAGGLLGMRWLATDVKFTAENGVIVSGTNTLTTTATYAAGLVQQATGHWTVPKSGINITGLTIAGPSNWLGLLVLDGYKDTKGLYLELTDKDSYQLGNSLTIPSTSRYDELVVSTGSDILTNGSKGIISITTDGDLIMDGANCNTYQNKYNQSNLSNDKSRYYYNLTSIKAKATKSDGEKLLLWSLSKYAASNISSNFTGGFSSNAISGTIDLEHISYYPIDAPSGVVIGNASFTFYNNQIEDSENGTGNSDNGVRTTLGASQHYLMHSGLFRNVSGTMSTNGNIHFKGSIGATGTYSGALINGTLSGNLTTSKEKEIVFEGLTISDPTKYLFINRMSTNSKLSLSGVRTGGGKDFSNADQSSAETKYAQGAVVASSLIGDVSGNGIQISFDRMKLDARTTAGAPSDLSAQYGTTKSIFSGATFLNRFAVDNNSTGTYNFVENLDWVSGVHHANVTYGKEIKTSKEYENKQQKYYDQTHFVDPANDPSSRTGVYPFDSGFLPYVQYSTATVASGENATRELKINVYVAGLPDGCGTYNHPYEITSGTQLTNVATTMSKTTGGYLSSLRLPKMDCQNEETLNSLISEHWCDDKSECAVFTHNTDTSKYTYEENGTTYTWGDEQVSLYLASAYYVVTTDITFNKEDSFPGLGASPTGDTTGKYAFRGVIVGGSSDGSVKITNKSGRYQVTSGDNDRFNTSGLITMSNGCVVKNLTIEVDIPTTDKYSYRSNENMAYGYNEDFPNYGAVINKIMGGDNIIDNVYVTYNNEFRVREGNDYKATVGGYVGCVVNGGLIFRNVDDASLTNFVVKKVNSNGDVQTVTVNRAWDETVTDPETGEETTVTHESRTITNLTDENDLIHIHVNPFVGRVINGYVIRETGSYGFSEDGATYGDGETRANAVEVTMHNTRKNYSIPDIDSTMNYQNDTVNGTTNALRFTKPEGENSYNTITVPNSQALFIMSIIAQSGSGCASSEDGNYGYNISYCGEKYRNYSSTTSGNNNAVDNNKATHWASYAHVGTATSTSDADYLLSRNDTINNRKAVPYIIYKYTSSYTSSGKTYYPARTLTKRTFYVNLTGGTAYYLPDCFRGIGFLGSAEYVNDNMKIYGFNGNGATIDLNAEYFTHRKAEDPYYDGNSIAMVCGLAMFNSLQQFTSDSSKQYKYESDTKYQITDFTIQGYISAHHLTTVGADDFSDPGGNIPVTHFSTAGFVSQIRDNKINLFNISSVNFNQFHINSYSYAGGFFAYLNDSSVRIYINNCNANGYKIEGCGRVGGFVGSYDSNKATEGGIHINTGLDEDGLDTFTSVMRNTIINNRYKKDNKSNYSAGIVGSVYCTQNASTTDQGDHAFGTLVLRNVTIEGGNAETNYIGNKNDPSGSSGGIMGGGTMAVKGCLIQNCIVKDIDIYGRYAGGIMGENANRRSSSSTTGARIVGCTVTGTLKNGKPQYSIMALQYAGGVYGDTRDNGTINAQYQSLSAEDAGLVVYNTDIDGVYIYGYNIYSINQDNLDNAETNTATSNNKEVTGYGAGGITGNNDNNRTIQNCKIEKCVIDVGTKSDSATNTPCGGLIGRISSGTVYGYNVEVKDCDFQTHQWDKNAAIGEGQTMIEARAYNIQKAYSYTDGEGITHNPVSGMKCGNFVGNGNSKTVNLIAVHSENNPAAVDFNSINTSATGSFIVYADYLDAGSGAGHGTAMSTLKTLTKGNTTYTEADEGGLKNYFPHVNVSPVTDMGSTAFLTSDGAALYKKSGTDTPIVDAIVSGGKYTTAGSTVSSAISSALSEGDDANKISTYYTEMGSLPDGVDDFAVVVINTENKVNSTNLINDYIRMVTNTGTGITYANDVVAGKYVIHVYPCTFDETTGNYVINADGKTAGLYYSTDSDQYYMQNGYADSNQGDYQFSLIDVQYLKPISTNNSTEVVYHLYVPVLTRKMMMFGFKSASLSGTDVILENFDHYGNTLAESLRSWYTGYVHFTYPVSELQNLLDNGTGLDWNISKTIQLRYTTEEVSSKLSGDTQIVLVDPYGADRYYYSKLSDLRPATDTNGSVDNVSLASFNTKLDGSGTGFTPTSLYDLMAAQGFTVTAQTGTTGATGYYYKETNVLANAAITIDGTMYEFVGEGASGNVKLTVQAPADAEMSSEAEDAEAVLKEDYYLCIRADGNRVYNYSIRTPAAIAGGSGLPSLRVSHLQENEITNIIMGDLYQQTMTINVKNNGTNNLEINSTNHRLDVSLRTTITLSGTSEDKDFILQHLQSGNINLYHAFVLTLTAYDTTGTRVEILGEPNVTATYKINGADASPAEGSFVGVSGNYILLNEHDIKNSLNKIGATTITAEVQIDFDEAWQYNQEFPKQDGSLTNIGVNVSAKSNLSYHTDGLVYTNMTASPSEPNTNYYYVKEADGAELVYNFKSGIRDEYDDAGYSSFNYSQQGVNPKNFIDQTQTRIPMQTVATYDATSIKHLEFATAQKVKFTLKLYKKTGAAGSAVYSEVSDVANYIDLDPDSVVIKDISGVVPAGASGEMRKSGSNELSYVVNVNQSAFSRQEDQRIDAEIDFTVITGPGFTEYANYRFVLTVDLLNSSDNSINSVSSAHDWVVYTNAKINPNMLTVAEAG